MLPRHYQNSRQNASHAGRAEHRKLHFRQSTPEVNTPQLFAIQEDLEAPEVNPQTALAPDQLSQDQTQSPSQLPRQSADENKTAPFLPERLVVGQRFSFVSINSHRSMGSAPIQRGSQKRQEETTTTVSNLPPASHPRTNQPRATPPLLSPRHVRHQGAVEPSRALGGLRRRPSARAASHRKSERQIARHGLQTQNDVSQYSYTRFIPARPPGQRYYQWALSEQDVKFIDSRFGR